MVTSVQPFPTNGVLAENLNLTYSKLAKRIGKPREAAYSYIVKSVESVNLDDRVCFEQHGSAPNFQGGRLTLCTCKHQMRSRLELLQWKDKWIAGFTSRCLYRRKHWLYFLTRVANAHESHANLWDSMPAAVRKAKSAEEDFLGDLFPPRGKTVGDGRFDPGRYHAPSRHSHRSHKCDYGWHNDINYKDRYGRRPPLLVGDPHSTFLWERPVICYDDHHCRDYLKWASVAELVSHLIGEAA